MEIVGALSGEVGAGQARQHEIERDAQARQRVHQLLHQEVERIPPRLRAPQQPRGSNSTRCNFFYFFLIFPLPLPGLGSRRAL